MLGPLLLVFGGRPLVDCIKKTDAIFGVGLGAWMGCNKKLDHYNVMVKSRLV
jgi:hypothetical protein